MIDFNILKKVLKRHTFEFALMAFFLFIGSFGAFISNYVEAPSAMINFPVGFAILTVGLILYGTTNSILYFFETEKIKKYGVMISGTLTKKYIEDDNWVHRDEYNRVFKSKEEIYWLEWEYQYHFKNTLQTFSGVAQVSKRKYNMFDIGENIPLKILPDQPAKSYPRFPRSK